MSNTNTESTIVEPAVIIIPDEPTSAPKAPMRVDMAAKRRAIELAKAERAAKQRANPRLSLIQQKKDERIALEQNMKDSTSFLYKNFTFWMSTKVNETPLLSLLKGLTKNSFLSCRKTYGMSLLAEIPVYLVNVIRIILSKTYANLYTAPGYGQGKDGLSDAERVIISTSLLNAYKQAEASDSALAYVFAKTLIIPLVAASVVKAAAFPFLSLGLLGANTTAAIGNEITGGIQTMSGSKPTTESSMTSSTKTMSKLITAKSPRASTTKGGSALSSHESSQIYDSRRGSIVDSTLASPVAENRYNFMHHTEPVLSADPEKVVFHADNAEDEEPSRVVVHLDDENDNIFARMVKA